MKRKKPPGVDGELPFGKLRRRSSLTPTPGKDPEPHQSRIEQGQGGWFQNGFLLSAVPPPPVSKMAPLFAVAIQFGAAALPSFRKATV